MFVGLINATAFWVYFLNFYSAQHQAELLVNFQINVV